MGNQDCLVHLKMKLNIVILLADYRNNAMSVSTLQICHEHDLGIVPVSIIPAQKYGKSTNETAGTRASAAAAAGPTQRHS